ncbi:MAG TPA: NAD(P)-dependent oxidoreductase [Sphingobium sp.]|uniref:NAD(P)-dependent oxidoreductase n=1 Tax=Sphingobium sp. TaxID=1912891 RepID=UPI002ED4C6BA
MKIGFIGLGSQGGPMAERLIAAGHETVLWARRPESLEPYKDTAATYAESVADLGAQCGIVGVCVVDDAGVETVCADLIGTMAPGGIIVIHSTINPDTCIALAAKAKAAGLSLIDAPVSGGGGGAAAGTLTVMLGGDEADVAAVKPFLEAFAGLIVHLGPVGAGQNAKLINNTLMAAHMGLAHNALLAADTIGVDRKALAELIKVSSGRSFGFEVAARLPQPNSFAHGGALLTKDVRLLGEVMGDDPAYAVLRGVAQPFLDQTQS